MFCNQKVLSHGIPHPRCEGCARQPLCRAGVTAGVPAVQAQELERKLGQKPAVVKKVLDQVAERIATGSHKGEFQLKPEYREG